MTKFDFIDTIIIESGEPPPISEELKMRDEQSSLDSIIGDFIIGSIV